MRDATAKAIEAWSRSANPLPAFDRTPPTYSHDFETDLETTIPAVESVPTWLPDLEEPEEDLQC